MSRAKQPLTGQDGEVRSLSKQDIADMNPLSSLPASLQGKLKKLGRPASENKKQAVSIRLDPDVLDAIRATGDGWQTRVNDALRSKFVR